MKSSMSIERVAGKCRNQTEVGRQHIQVQAHKSNNYSLQHKCNQHYVKTIIIFPFSIYHVNSQNPVFSQRID